MTSSKSTAPAAESNAGRAPAASPSAGRQTEAGAWWSHVSHDGPYRTRRMRSLSSLMAKPRESTLAALWRCIPSWRGLDRHASQSAMPPGGRRKRAGIVPCWISRPEQRRRVGSAWRPAPRASPPLYDLMGAPEARAAAHSAGRAPPLLQNHSSVAPARAADRAVRKSARIRIIVDANEALTSKISKTITPHREVRQSAGRAAAFLTSRTRVGAHPQAFGRLRPTRAC